MESGQRDEAETEASTFLVLQTECETGRKGRTGRQDGEVHFVRGGTKVGLCDLSALRLAVRKRAAISRKRGKDEYVG